MYQYETFLTYVWKQIFQLYFSTKPHQQHEQWKTDFLNIGRTKLGETQQTCYHCFLLQIETNRTYFNLIPISDQNFTQKTPQCYKKIFLSILTNKTVFRYIFGNIDVFSNIRIIVHFKYPSITPLKVCCLFLFTVFYFVGCFYLFFLREVLY